MTCAWPTCTHILPEARGNHKDHERSEQANSSKSFIHACSLCSYGCRYAISMRALIFPRLTRITSCYAASVTRSGVTPLILRAPNITTRFSSTIVARKRAHGRCTLLRAQTGGWADIRNIAAFYQKKAPMFTFSQPTTGYCKPTHLPSTSLIQFSVCISQACVASHKWTSPSILTFQEKDSSSTQ